MGLLIAITVALSIWIVGWATGGKAFDWFLLSTAIVVVAATTRIVLPFLPGRGRDG